MFLDYMNIYLYLFVFIYVFIYLYNGYTIYCQSILGTTVSVFWPVPNSISERKLWFMKEGLT